MIGSKEINKAIKEYIRPILRLDGYSVIQPRKAWKHFDNKVYHFLISAVGNYFSMVTGFPPMSVTASLNIYYINFPDGKTVQKFDKKGLPLPKRHGFCDAIISITHVEPPRAVALRRMFFFGLWTCQLATLHNRNFKARPGFIGSPRFPATIALPSRLLRRLALHHISQMQRLHEHPVLPSQAS